MNALFVDYTVFDETVFHALVGRVERVSFRVCRTLAFVQIGRFVRNMSIFTAASKNTELDMASGIKLWWAWSLRACVCKMFRGKTNRCCPLLVDGALVQRSAVGRQRKTGAYSQAFRCILSSDPKG